MTKKTNEERAREQAEKLRAAFAASQTERAGLSGEQAAPVAAAPAGVPLSPVRRVAPGLLTPNKRNTFAPLPPDEFARLRDDIQARGVLVPLVVLPARTNPDNGLPENQGGAILAGHNRHAVALALGLASVPVQYVERPLTDADERRFIVADNLLRRQLTPADKAALLAELYPGLIEKSAGGRPAKKGDTVSPFSGLTAGTAKKGDTVSPFPGPTVGTVAAELGTTERTVQRLAATAREAANKAAARGAAKPTPDDYRAAADDRNRARKEKAGPAGRDFPGMNKADKANRGKGPRPFAGPDLSTALGRLLDAASDRVGQDDPVTIARELVAELKNAGLV